MTITISVHKMKRILFSLFLYISEFRCATNEDSDSGCPAKKITIEQLCENECKLTCNQNITMDVKAYISSEPKMSVLLIIGVYGIGLLAGLGQELK